MSNFKVVAKEGNARAGVLQTAHGEIQTPVFMPVGTQGSVKALSPDDLKEAKSQIILGNTYHLYLRPGNKLIKKMGGLHKFIGWGGPILTDSGGFQAFSLGAAIEHGVKKIQNNTPASRTKGKSQNYNLKVRSRAGDKDEDTIGADIVSNSYLKKPEKREKLRENSKEWGRVLSEIQENTFSKITEDGVIFKSHLDGSSHLLTPEKSIQIQMDLGSDIVLALDELLSPLHNRHYVKRSLERTHRWEIESQRYFKKYYKKLTNPSPILFGILQGVYDNGIREEEAKWIANQGFDGVSIGGSFGISQYWNGNKEVIPANAGIQSTELDSELDPRLRGDDSIVNWAAAKAINETFEWVVPLLPPDLPRHGLGIGEVQNLFDSVERGIDMFDCVSPTRRARNGSLYISPKNGGKMGNRFVISIQRAQFADDKKVIDPGCECYCCQNFSRAYLRHLFISSELLYHRLASMHNVYFINNMVDQIREAILNKQFMKLKDKWLN